MNIYQKLQKIQNELKVNKGQRNNFGNYNYRSAEDILEAIKPLQEKYKVMFRITEELVEIGSNTAINSSAIAFDYEDGGQVISNATAIIDFTSKGMQMPQRTGSASSYAKKYALGNLLLIDDTKDSDALNNHGKSSKTTSAKTLPELKIGSKAYQQARDKFLKGETGLIDKLKQHYVVSKIVEQSLIKK